MNFSLYRQVRLIPLLPGVFSFFLFGILFSFPAISSVLHMRSDVAYELLSESDPTAWAPNRFGIEDFEVTWVGNPLEGVRFYLGKESFEWVRVMGILRLPRGRILVHAKGYDSGKASHEDFTRNFRQSDEELKVELPVALLSGPEHHVELELKRNGKIHKAVIQIQFRPRNDTFKNEKSHVFFDHSCSKWGLNAEDFGDWKNEWAYVGCRFVRVKGKDHPTSSLEVYLYWDNVGEKVQIGSADTDSVSPSLWTFRLGPETKTVTFKVSKEKDAKPAEIGFHLNYSVPGHLHNGGLGIGLGPYWALFRQESAQMESNFTLLTTLYGSYFLTEEIRIVGFGAIAVEPRARTDFGVYLNFEQLRFLDQRVGIKLLVGLHATGIVISNQFFGVPSFPQGVEIIFSDAFKPGNDLMLGAFAYPLIAGNSYYNIWLRWGGATFVELNYIAWQTQINSSTFFSSFGGISVGFPLFQFL